MCVTPILTYFRNAHENIFFCSDEEKSAEEGKNKKTKGKFKDDVSLEHQVESKKKKKRPFFKNDSEEDEKDSITSPDDDYNPILSQIADEELILDDPAILKFMELEMKKKRRPPPEMMMRRPPLPRFRRSVVNPMNISTTMSPPANATTNSSIPTSTPPFPAFQQGRSGRRRDSYQDRRRRRFFREPLHPIDPNQFISKRRLELKNEKDFKKRLNLAADAGRTLRNRRQCRLLFNDCPLDDKQIDSLVVGLRRVMESNGNLAAILPPTTTLAPAVQAAVDAVKKTAAAQTVPPPGSKVEIILHLNQNGMPYGVSQLSQDL